MPPDPVPLRRTVAVVGAGPAGAACAAALHAAGLAVTVFDKSRGVGGRMSTRRTRYTDAQGVEHTVHFDHGAQHVGARHAAFLQLMQAAVQAGCAVPWQPVVDGEATTPSRQRFLPVPGMPALCQHLLRGVTVQLQATVSALQRTPQGGWALTLAEHAAEPLPFDQVVLAMPPAQAAVLLAPHDAAWAEALRSVVMNPCWTLMAVSSAAPLASLAWDAQVPAAGPLAWVSRNHRRPGRATPPGCASWVAQARADWSQQHLEDDPQQVTTALLAALADSVGQPLDVHYSAVHRWRYALPAATASAATATPPAPWWDTALGLGVCGDGLGGPDVESAWMSGDALGRAILDPMPAATAR